MSAAVLQSPVQSSRALVFQGPGKPLAVAAVQLPEQLEPGSLLVRIECASVCGTDVHMRQGFGQTPGVALQVAGHEAVGRVVAVGAGAETDSIGTPLREGDRVIWAKASCGRCHACRVLHQPGLCAWRTGMQGSPEPHSALSGAFAEYAYVSPYSERIRVPDGVASPWASAASCALRTVMHVFDRLGRIAPTETVLVQGTGPIGLFSILVARYAGARRVTAIGDPAGRLELAASWGADAVFSLSDTDLDGRRDALAALTDHRGVDIVIEASGAAAAFTEALDLVADNGRIALAGSVGSATVAVAPGLAVRKNLSIMGIWSATMRHYWQALDFLARTATEVDYDLMFADPVGLEQVNSALEAMAAGAVVKPLIRPDLDSPNPRV